MVSEKHTINLAVADAIQRALTCLASRQLASGEFPVLVSKDSAMAKPRTLDPSVFPTALMAQSLAFAPDAASLVQRAAAFVTAQMGKYGLWKHWTHDHPHVKQLPPDLDDTCCASVVMRNSGRPFPDNHALLLANRDKRGLFYTWMTPRARWSGLAHLKVTLPQLRHGFTLYLFFKHTSATPADVDAVVNANALFYLGDFEGRELVVDHLLGILRQGSESFCDKWYDNPFVVWYFLSRALAGVAPEAGELITQRLASANPTNALESALAICCLMDWQQASVDDRIAALLALQLDTGLWPCAPLYHGGRLRQADGSFAAPHPDTPYWGSDELTTAFCIEALSRWLKEFSS